jgi:hypothetical protein
VTYSDFTLEAVLATFSLQARQEPLFPDVTPLEVPPWLREALEKGLPFGLGSEKARSEFLIGPILLTCRDVCQHAFAIYSGQRLDVDPQQGLVGECDFVLARTAPLPFVQSPVVTIVEAKKQDIEAGLGQCAAQMVGARLFNQAKGSPIPTIFGCVTTGEAWQFLKLHEEVLTIDRDRTYIDNVGRILAIFQAMMC